MYRLALARPRLLGSLRTVRSLFHFILFLSICLRKKLLSFAYSTGESNTTAKNWEDIYIVNLEKSLLIGKSECFRFSVCTRFVKLHCNITNIVT